MSRAESGSVSAETSERETDTPATGAYISPLADFLLLFLVTAAGALTVSLLL